MTRPNKPAHPRTTRIEIEAPDAETLDAIRGLAEARHLHGECAPVACVLHEALGLPIVIVRRVSDNRLLHVGVRSGNQFRDIRGVVSQGDFIEPYEAMGPIFIADADVDTLRDEAPWSDYSEKVARANLAFLFSDMPQAVEDAERMAAFGRELTDLCRKHKLWLRPAHANSMILYEAYGDETGFRFSPFTPGQAAVDRLLGEPTDIDDDEPPASPAP